MKQCVIHAPKLVRYVFVFMKFYAYEITRYLAIMFSIYSVSHEKQAGGRTHTDTHACTCKHTHICTHLSSIHANTHKYIDFLTDF